MPPKQPTCAVCGHKLQKGDKGYAHKKKEHWAGQAHPAIPVFDSEV